MNDYCIHPPFIAQNTPPLVMLAMAKDEKLFYRAYNDLVDLNGDGVIDSTYNDTISYYGYFHPNICYVYSSSRFEPSSAATGTNSHYCSGKWSGNFLNWASMARVDILRKVLYGGKRTTDTAGTTVLSRTVLPQDAHSWAKAYKGSDLSSLTPYNFASGITICNTNTDSTQISGLIFAIKGYYPYAASTEGKECTKTAVVGGVNLNNVGIGSLGSGSADADYAAFNADVKVCDSSVALEANCKPFGANYKPGGLLQRYGLSRQGSSGSPLMYFGLMTGSYSANVSGGVLRSNLTDIATTEIDSTTGQVQSSSKIIKNLDRFRVVGYNYGTGWYNLGGSEGSCVPGEPYNLANGSCKSWGNPVGEMFYETMRYFAGKASATSAYTNSGDPDGGLLGLTFESTWLDPYTNGGPGGIPLPYCSKPFALILSDIFTNYDSNELPGSFWNTFTSDMTGLNVQTAINDSGINDLEGLTTGKNIFVGQVGSTASDRQCTPKSVNNFGNIRGLCVEEPTKRGTYYVAGLANFAKTHDLHTATGDQKMATFVVATESITPIEVTSGNSKVTIVPTFHDGCPDTSLSGCTSQGQGGDNSKGTLVYMRLCPDDADWNTENTTNGFTQCYDVMWDDAEYGWDYDLDIALRHYIKVAGGSITVKTKGLYAAAGHLGYAGYFISGTASDGLYYDIRCGGGAGFNNCQKHDGTGSIAGGTAYTERTYSITGGGGGFLKDPLWYAAKYGGFDDINGDGKPNLVGEWDQDGNSTPDTYFYASNPLLLESKLGQAMQEILGRVASGTAATVLASSEGSGANMLQAVFYPKRLFEGNEATWTGEIQNLWYYIDPQLNSSTIREDTTEGSSKDTLRTLNLLDDYVIFYDFDAATNTIRVLRYSDPTGYGPYTLVDSIPIEKLKYLWAAGQSLFLKSPSTRNIKYGKKSGSTWALDDFLIGNFPSPDDAVFNNTFAGDPTTAQIIDYIRGTDSTAFRSRTVTVNGVTGVWKLGDIVSSTPRIQSSFPLNSYHLPPADGYNDRTYLSFINTTLYKGNGMVYAGANDGMLHAFNLGKLQYLNNGAEIASLSTPGTVGNQFGEERWAYIPKNALPYLKYLLSKDYCHLFYVDLPPTIIDASINGSADGTKTASSWKTILIGGMGLGGACRGRTTWCNDTSSPQNCVNIPKDDIGYSSYFALDVTDQNNPTLLWEFTDPALGFSTSGPAIVRTGDRNKNGQWMVVFASGPTGPIDTSSFHQFMGKSDQELKLFVRDLATGADMGTLSTGITNGFGGSLHNAGVDLERGEPERSSHYQDDVFYVGYTTNQEGGSTDTTWSKGGVLRVMTYNLATPGSWSVSKLIGGIGPVTSAVTNLHDKGQSKAEWVYFGTGRFYYRRGVDIDDKETQQAIYGIKDPCYTALRTNVTCTESALSGTGDLADQSGTTLNSLTGKRGWFINLALQQTISSVEYGAERVITDPLAIFSGAVFYTTFSPAADPCSLGGNTALWAVNYATGGPVTLSGKALMQISTGEVKQIDLSSAFTTKAVDSKGRRTVNFKGMPPRGQGLSVLVKPKPLRKILQMKEK